MSLKGKVAIVTGASRGIGQAIALTLATAGATVVVNYVSQVAKAQAVVAEIEQAGGEATAMSGDLSKLAEIEALFVKTKELYGHIDIVVHNAGIALFKPHAEVTEAEFDQLFHLNAKGTFFILQQAARHICDGGRIVNIVTGSTKLPMPAGGLYAGSKAASELFALCLSKELGARGVTVNNVSPGVTQTGGLILPPLVLEQLKQQTPLGRFGEPNDIANLVAFLVSEEGGWITSQTIQANGGLL